jgi:hypothetical protein
MRVYEFNRVQRGRIFGGLGLFFFIMDFMKFTGGGGALFYQVSGIARIGEEMNDSVIILIVRYFLFLNSLNRRTNEKYGLDQ